MVQLNHGSFRTAPPDLTQPTGIHLLTTLFDLLDLPWQSIPQPWCGTDLRTLRIRQTKPLCWLHPMVPPTTVSRRTLRVAILLCSPINRSQVAGFLLGQWIHLLGSSLHSHATRTFSIRGYVSQSRVSQLISAYQPCQAIGSAHSKE